MSMSNNTSDLNHFILASRELAVNIKDLNRYKTDKNVENLTFIR